MAAKLFLEDPIWPPLPKVGVSQWWGQPLGYALSIKSYHFVPSCCLAQDIPATVSANICAGIQSGIEHACPTAERYTRDSTGSFALRYLRDITQKGSGITLWVREWTYLISLGTAGLCWQLGNKAVPI